MAAHELSVGRSDEWYTPPYVFKAMGCRFDLDVASPETKLPWVPCEAHYYKNSLETPWFGFVWMNPPFGGRNKLAPWLHKFFDHGDGVALMPDRTSAPWWQFYAPKASCGLQVSRKIKFIRPDGSVGKHPGTGTTLLAVGQKGEEALRNAARNGLGLLWKPLLSE